MARLDVGWCVNPKVLGLGLSAMGLHAWSISYCDATRSDGFIPKGAWPSLLGVRAAVAALERAGMWSACEGGYRLHDYTEYNSTRAQIEARQAGDRERKHLPESGRNPNGNSTDSNGIPRAPYPGPLSTELNDAAAAVNSPGASRSRARARGDGGFQPLGALLKPPAAAATADSSSIPDEVRERLARPPISAHR
jgi:hypothetical protein